LYTQLWSLIYKDGQFYINDGFEFTSEVSGTACTRFFIEDGKLFFDVDSVNKQIWKDIESDGGGDFLTMLKRFINYSASWSNTWTIVYPSRHVDWFD